MPTGCESFILFAGDGEWRIGPTDGSDDSFSKVPVPAGTDPQGVASSLAEALRGRGYAGDGVLLALAGRDCLCAGIPTDNLPARDRRRAMLYRLEEKLPLAAEDVVADFVETGQSATGVCTEKRSLAPLVEAMEQNGIAITAICPASLLALQQHLGTLDDADLDAVIWQRERDVELFLLEADRPTAWYLLGDDSRDLLVHLGLAALDRAGPLKVRAIGLKPTARQVLASAQGVRIESVNAISQAASASAMGGEILAGRAEPWINLRRDDLAVGDKFRPVRGPLMTAVVAVAILVICLCGGMLWRAAQYDRLAARHGADQEAVFRQVFPRQTIPLDVRSRLASEERALRGLSGDTGAPPPASPGLIALRDVLAALPADVRFRMTEVRLDGSRFSLEGQAKTHADADAIAAALRRQSDLTVEPPRSEQLPDAADGTKSVRFSINGGIAGVAAGRAGP